MTKKLLAVVMALAVMVTACSMMAFAAETPTDIVEDIYLQLEPNGAQGRMDDILANENGVVVVPEHGFTNDNFNFLGWNTEKDGAGEEYQPGDEITLKETTKLYAQWMHKDAQIDEFVVTYDPNGGTGEVIDIFGPYMYGNYVYTCYNEFEKAGATFIEWNTEKDGSGQSFAEDEMFEIYESITLYAIWEGGEEEEIVDTPVDGEIVDEVVTDTDTNPETGSASVAGAVVAGVVALGALAVLKKRD